MVSPLVVSSAASIGPYPEHGHASNAFPGCPHAAQEAVRPTRRGCRWYLRFGLSYRDIEELLAERGVEVDHVTVYQWVLRFTPLLAEAARPCCHAVGDRWQVDETYVKVAGRWRYVYRAIDQFGQVVDVLIAERRDERAAYGSSSRRSGQPSSCPSRSPLIRRWCIR